MTEQIPYRYAIGIDLGTSNSAIAFIDLAAPESQPSILPLLQWETADRFTESDLLPSAVYFPAKDEQRTVQRVGGWSHHHIVGRYARERQLSTPQRVIASAKSWLCHKGVDRQNRILPWMSPEIAQEQKLSPVDASALILNYIQVAWDQRIGIRGSEHRFERQHIVITVPASFDQEAQKLTLAAATRAGYPSQTRLLEEPQAAFYSWLDLHRTEKGLEEILTRNAVTLPAHILVCDVGGGTLDLSLFRATGEAAAGDQQKQEPGLAIQRVAVSDHILLGGDNIDYAIARRFEEKLQTGGSATSLSLFAWQKLTGQCRLLKERLLSEAHSAVDDDDNAHFHISITQEKGSLFSNSVTVSLSRNEIMAIVMEGFFPRCGRTDRPATSSSGLRELGLPYAQDCAITRHIASFCADYERIDAVLFNGGAFNPRFLQTSIIDLIGTWQSGAKPLLLENRELDKAVAKGAALYGRALAMKQGCLITGGSPHSYYLELVAQQKQDTTYLLCIVPRGTELESIQRIKNIDLQIVANQAVEFRLYYSIRRGGDHTGQLLRYNQTDFTQLPPLQTFVRIPTHSDRTATAQIPVQIEAKLNAVGLLGVSLVDAQAKGRNRPRWELEFNVRVLVPQKQQPLPEEETLPGSHSETLTPELKCAVAGLLNAPFRQSLIKEMETLLNKKKSSWNKSWLRQFLDILIVHITRRNLSEEYETSWLNAAGYFLRPGYGAALDERRISQLWNLTSLGIANPKSKAVREQYFVLWRRVAGGLSSAQQSELYAEIEFLIGSHVKQAHEAIRMACSFEYLPLRTKKKLLATLLEGVSLLHEKHCEHYLWGLGRLLSRIPLYATEEHIMPPDAVAACFDVFKGLDWTLPTLGYTTTLFSIAGRKTLQRALDIDDALRTAILQKMELSGAKEKSMRQVKEYTKVEYEDLAILFGESLPSGLILGSF